MSTTLVVDALFCFVHNVVVSVHHMLRPALFILFELFNGHKAKSHYSRNASAFITVNASILISCHVFYLFEQMNFHTGPVTVLLARDRLRIL